EFIYRENVSPAPIQNRPMMCRLLEQIQKENCTGVLVVDPQRLSRGDLQDCGTISRIFRYTSTAVITPQKIYHLDDKYDRKFFESELMRGNDYLEYVKEIMLRGRLASVREGNYIGSVPPYGYQKAKIGKADTLVENPEEADIVRLIFDLFVNQNLGIVTICRKLDESGRRPRKAEYWTQDTIKGILQNPVYTGKIRWNFRKTVKVYEDGRLTETRPRAEEADWIIVDGKHPALIPEEMYQAALAKFGSCPRIKAKAKLINPFAGLCQCECGKAMILKSSPKAQLRIMCQQQVHCHNKSALYSEFEQEVIRILEENLTEIQSEYETSQKQYTKLQNNLIVSLEKELTAMETQQEKLYDFLERGIYTEEIFIRRNQALAEHREQTEQALERARAEQAVQLSYEEKILIISQAVDCLRNRDILPDVKNGILKQAIRKIKYTRKVPRSDKTPFTLEISLWL
ncbi:MAG: recombinase family protein, partial [Oscillospiraceae bacterium]|nr:recombinase family protein [Oscillospiraceae bacterium]